jgi:hypothetical protein
MTRKFLPSALFLLSASCPLPDLLSQERFPLVGVSRYPKENAKPELP